ncbi:hypothetical protein B0H11DRAFT_734461 [Mycena galericulata]|nr:hypothetical protein B0H11DRAFT_734461 [Mycena galericulata]
MGVRITVPCPLPSMATSHDSLSQGIVIGLSDLNAVMPKAFVEAERQLAFVIATSVAFAIIAWEYVALLPDEIRLYRKPVWATVPPYAFLVLRYGGILATVPALFLGVFKSSNCQALASFSQAGVVLVVSSCAIIFTFRTSLLWGHNRIVRATLGGIVLMVVASYVAVCTQYRAEFTTNLPLDSNCRILPTLPWVPVANASSTTFFITALVLTLLKMQYHHPRDSLVAYRIYRDNTVYLTGTTLTTATWLVIQSLSPPSSALALCTASIATVLIVGFGTRGFRNLMLAAVLEAERQPSLPYPSTSPVISHANEIRYAHPPPTRPATAPTSRHPKLSSRPHTADTDASTAHLNPYTTFPSPPNSYTNHSILSSPSSSQSPLSASMSPVSLSPLRRGAARQTSDPKSGWSDL